MSTIDLTLALLSLPPLAAASYLALLSIAAREKVNWSSNYSAPRTRFDVVVPAHDEEDGIAATVASLLALDYPPALLRVVVVADNCTDATAERAEEAGAIVVRREEPDQRGKGYALAFGFAWAEQNGWADAAVVVDADTVASPNLLRAFARRIEAGDHALQARYGVRNPGASWRTRLMVIALALFHDVRSLGRARLGLSCGLRGNGMAFSREALRRVPHRAFSIVEDVEHGIALGEAGYRVRYVPEARVLGEMVSGESASRSQRRRWERGRREIARTRGPRLFWDGVRRRSAALVDLAIDAMLPPLATIALVIAAGLAAAAALAATGGSAWPAIPWIASAALLALYVFRGVAISGAGARGLVDLLLFAPVYVLWKIALSLGRPDPRRGEWVRTAREVRHDP